MRKYTPSAYVILSNQLGNADPKEQLSFARNFNHVVIDMHYYHLYLDEFSNMNVQFYALKIITTVGQILPLLLFGINLSYLDRT